MINDAIQILGECIFSIIGNSMMTSLIENENENYAAALQIDFTIEVCIEPRKQERLVCYEEE